ncbi:MAG: Bug family tripartite tricarboxylate transporter substrate binding protein [Beijerinckiaceae bacterium]
MTKNGSRIGVCIRNAAIGAVSPVFLAVTLPAAGHAQPATASFYTGKTISLVVGYKPGGGYDQSARILARHFAEHIPGKPAMIVRNMPGAGTVVAANYVNNTAPKDGTVIGLYADLLTIAPLLQTKGVKFDPREFGWLGSMASRGTPVVVVRRDGPAQTYEQATQKEVLIGASGPDATSAYALLINETLGTKFKVLMGYTGGTSEIDLAIERGEVHGRASGDWYTIKQHKKPWLEKKLVTVMMQLSLKPNPDLKGVPLAIDLAKTDADKQLMELVFGTAQYFRAFSVAKGVPADRLAALRKAFDDTAKDPAFVKDWSVQFAAGVDYSSYKDIEGFLNRVYSFPPSVAARARKFLGGKK